MREGEKEGRFAAGGGGGRAKVTGEDPRRGFEMTKQARVFGGVVWREDPRGETARAGMTTDSNLGMPRKASEGEAEISTRHRGSEA